MGQKILSAAHVLNICERTLRTMTPERITRSSHVDTHTNISRFYTAVKFGGNVVCMLDRVDGRRGRMFVKAQFPTVESLRSGKKEKGVRAVLPTLARLELAEESGMSWLE